jgi:Fe-S cluster biogenesis protein NfuA
MTSCVINPSEKLMNVLKLSQNLTASLYPSLAQSSGDLEVEGVRKAEDCTFVGLTSMGV